jgi:uncharacterized protein (TIGR02001 family)
MKLLKLSLAAAVLATGILAADESEIGISANVAATSNYVWRGMTQSDDSPAIQGGFDLEYKGFYVGTWGSSVQFGDTTTAMEADLYAGYSGGIDDFSYDVGYVQFMYPGSADELNFGEAYIGLGYDFKVLSVGAKYYFGIDTNDVDVAGAEWEPADSMEASVSVPLPAEITFDGLYGQYGKDGDDNGVGKYYSVGLSKSFGKFDFTVAYTGMDFFDAAADDQNHFLATVGTSF